jgi:hypothetical protein
MVIRALVVLSAVLASVFIVACSSCSDDNHFPIGSQQADAKVWKDAAIDSPPPVPCTCTNGTMALTGSGTSETETLIVVFNCGTTCGGGSATVFLHSPASEGSGSGSGSGSGTDGTTTHDFTCGNNTLTFPADILFKAHELVGSDFDLTCM